MKNDVHFNFCRIKYYIKPYKEEWILKKEGGHIIIKKDKHKNLLKSFAFDFCKVRKSELIILNKDGSVQEKASFYEDQPIY